MLDAPHCLHWLLILLRSQMLDLPHCLQLGLLRLCLQMLDPRAALLGTLPVEIVEALGVPSLWLCKRTFVNYFHSDAACGNEYRVLSLTLTRSINYFRHTTSASLFESITVYCLSRGVLD